MNRISLARDLLSQLHFLQRWAANALEHGGETSSSSAAWQELMELFRTQSANDDGSSYGRGDSSGLALWPTRCDGV